MARRIVLAGWLRRYQPRHGDWQPAHRIRTDRVDARDVARTREISLARVTEIAATGGAR